MRLILTRVLFDFDLTLMEESRANTHILPPCHTTIISLWIWKVAIIFGICEIKLTHKQ